MRQAVCIAVGILMLAGAAFAPAQEPLEASGLEAEVRALNRTLGELVELLRRQLESSNATVLMQRVQLMTSRIAPLEQELRSTRDRQEGLEQEIERMELMAREYEAQMTDAIDQGGLESEEQRQEMERQLEMFAGRQKQARDRLWTASQRVIDLEQQLAARRAEIETWEVEIDRVLGLR